MISGENSPEPGDSGCQTVKKILSTVFPNLFMYTLCFPSGSVGKESPAKPETQETQV